MTKVSRHLDQPKAPANRESAKLRRRALALTGGVLAGLVGFCWLGVQTQPAPFRSYPRPSERLATVPLPDTLPAPVERFYRQIYGERIPVIHSVVLTGRATLHVNGITLPARYRFTHRAGQNYRHYIEATFFGFPIMKVDESYIDGRSRQEMPWGTTDNAPKANQAANLGMWAELMAVPSVYLTDKRVRWEGIDRETALLVVPFGNDVEHFVVRFDPRTGLVDLMEAMRYRNAGKGAKILWLARSVQGSETPYGQIPNAVGTATWLDQGKPWATFRTEDVVLNADVIGYIRAKGL